MDMNLKYLRSFDYTFFRELESTLEHYYVRSYSNKSNGLPLLNGMSLLDIGCGNGYHTKKYADLGAICQGLDSPKNISLAEKNFPDISFKAFRKGQAFPYEDSSFDIIISQNYLQKYSKLDNALSEIHRVLAPGGILQYSVVHPMKQFIKDYGINTDSIHDSNQSKHKKSSRFITDYLAPSLFGPSLLRDYRIFKFEEYIDPKRGYPCFLMIQAIKKSW